MNDLKLRLYAPSGERIERNETQVRKSDDTRRVVTKFIRTWFQQIAEFMAFHQLNYHCGICRERLTEPTYAWRHWGECQGHRPAPQDGAGMQIIKTPTGFAWARHVEKVELKAAQIEWLRQAQDVCAYFDLGIHCDKCAADITGRNADTDPIFSAACGCREFLGPNRDYRPPSTAESFYESYNPNATKH